MFFFKKIIKQDTGEIAPLLRELSSLVKDVGSVPSTYMVTYKPSATLIFSDLSGLLNALGTHAET